MKKTIFIMLFLALGLQQAHAQQDLEILEPINVIVPFKPQIFTSGGLIYNTTSPTTARVAANPGISGAITIPAQVTNNGTSLSVTSIGANAFKFSSLTSVTIPNSVTSIGQYAFYGCSNLTYVVCEMVTPLSIYSTVFEGVNQSACWLTVPKASVAAYAAAAVWQDFAHITCATPTENTTTVTACPNYVWANNYQTYIESGTYSGTTANCVTEQLVLTIISTATDQTNFSSGGLNYVVTSPTTVAIGINSGATGAIIIPASVSNACFNYTVTSIGYGSFEGCSGLTSVTIPNSVTSIGDGAFANCSGLTSVVIPTSVTSIGIYAFYYCSKLTSVICNIVNPLSINSTVFEGVNQGACSLKVPNGSISAYAAALI